MNKLMKTILIKSFIFTLLCFFIEKPSVFSQTDDYKEKVTVVGVYLPEISDHRKIIFNPDIKDTINYIPKMEYKVVARPLDVEIELTPISAARMTGESFAKIFENHIRAGIGNYLTPYLEFFHNSIRNKNFRYSINMKHHSSLGNINDYAYQGFSENLINLNGSWLLSKDYSLSAGTKFKRDGLHYYGFMPDTLTPEFENSDIKQIFNKYDFFFEGKSQYSDKSKFHHLYRIEYNGLWDRFETAENNIHLTGFVKKYINLANGLQNEAINVDFRGAMFRQNNKLNLLSDGLISFKPEISFSLKEINVKAGVDFSAQIDSVGEFMMFPFVRMDLNIVPSYLNVFIGFDKGKLEKSTFRQLSEINPFINTEILPLGFTVTKDKLYGGVNGSFGGIFNYKLGLENKTTENMPLFVNDTIPFLNDTTGIFYGNRFGLVHDTIQTLSFNAELQLKLNSRLSLMALGRYNVYTAQNQTHAWHMPLYQINVAAEYNIQNKIYARAGIITHGDRYALNLKTGEEIKLSPIWDFNLGFEYRYNRLMSAFININNFTAQRHYYWNNFPSQRFNVLAGVTYTF